MKTLTITILISMCYPQLVSGQGVEGRALRVGDMVPDATFPVLNYSKKTLKLSDFNDKLVIIDLWTLACVPCVQSLPTVDSLQRKFKDQVQFLPLTWEPLENLIPFFARVAKTRKFVVPFPLDSTYHKLFMEESRWVGSYVWIKYGRIIGFTYGKDNLNEQGIRQALQTGSIGTRPGVGTILRPLLLPPKLINGINKNVNSILGYSAFTRYADGYESDVLRKDPEKNDSTSGIRIINNRLAFFYTIAYNFDYSWDVLYEMKDPSLFYEGENPDTTILYCYEVMKPKCERAELLEIMKSDLKRTFGYEVSKDVRDVNCGILKVKDSTRIMTRGGKPLIEFSNFYLTLKNQPFRMLALFLTQYMVSAKQRFIIDESGIKSNVDLSIDCDLKDPIATKAALAKIGISLTFENRTKEMIIVSDPVK